MEAITCIACGKSVPRTPWGEKDGYTLKRCGSCGLIAVDPIPTSTDAVYETPDYFSGATQGFGYVNYDADKEAMRGVFEAYCRHIESQLPHKGRLLDIGAATGFFVALALAHGWKAEGVELSEYAAQQGRDRGLTLATGTLEELAPAPETYDAITLFDVIEHVRDPRAELDRVARALVPGGVVLITTPDAGSLFAKLFGTRWHLVVPPEHLYYFTRESMMRLLSSLGFVVDAVTRPGKRFTLRYFFATVARWLPVFPLPQIARYLARHERLGDVAIPFNTYDNLLVVAHKK